MTSATLSISLSAIQRNHKALASKVSGETGAVVKANGYGLSASQVAKVLLLIGVRRFFVATAQEGTALRKEIGSEPEIHVFSGHMAGDTDAIREAQLIPHLNSVDQMLRHFEASPDAAFAVQLDSGMNRLGMEPAEWAAVREIALAQEPAMISSHLACADEPDHPMNRQQLECFKAMTDGVGVPRSLSATGGILLGPEYHFDITRPGIGLYGGQPFGDAHPVVSLNFPVIQVRDVDIGETVGYGNSWTAKRQSRIATLSGGYADGLIRAMGGKAALYAGDVACPIVGRVSMDLITLDVTDLEKDPEYLQLIGKHQSVDDVAEAAGTIGYEILTSLGTRYERVFSS